MLLLHSLASNLPHALVTLIKNWSQSQKMNLMTFITLPRHKTSQNDILIEFNRRLKQVETIINYESCRRREVSYLCFKTSNHYCLTYNLYFPRSSICKSNPREEPLTSKCPLVATLKLTKSKVRCSILKMITERLPQIPNFSQEPNTQRNRKWKHRKLLKDLQLIKTIISWSPWPLE